MTSTERAGAELRRQGWTLLRDWFEPAAVAALHGAVEALGARAAAALAAGSSGPPLPGERQPALIVVPEAADPAMVCRYEYVAGTEPSLRRTLVDRVASLIEACTGEPWRLFKDKVNNKHPGGGAFRAHQDIAAYRAFGPAFHVTAMIAIDPATLENGCLWAASDYLSTVAGAPGAVEEWRGGLPVLHSHVGGPLNGDVRSDIADRLAWEPVPMRPADLLLFDSFVPHRSEVNRSDRSRRAMFLTFNAAREGDWYERYYEEKRRNPLDPKFHVSTPTAHAALRT